MLWNKFKKKTVFMYLKLQNIPERNRISKMERYFIILV